MPRESVYIRPTLEDERECERTGQPLYLAQKRKVTVGWARGMHVQIGVEWVDDEATAEKRANPDVSFAPDGLTDEHMRVWRSQWMELDRHGINELMRKLRRARDAAFGKDE